MAGKAKARPKAPRRAVTVYLEEKELAKLTALAASLGVTKSRAMGALLMGGTLKRLQRLSGLPDANEEEALRVREITESRAKALKELQEARALSSDEEDTYADDYADEEAYGEEGYAEPEEEEDDGEWYR